MKGICWKCYNEHMSIDWSKMYKKYAGLWVALADDEITVIASDKKLVKAIEVSAKKGVNDPIVNRVPDEVVTFAGYGLPLQKSK